MVFGSEAEGYIESSGKESEALRLRSELADGKSDRWKTATNVEIGASQTGERSGSKKERGRDGRKNGVFCLDDF